MNDILRKASLVHARTERVFSVSAPSKTFSRTNWKICTEKDAPRRRDVYGNVAEGEILAGMTWSTSCTHKDAEYGFFFPHVSCLKLQGA